MNQTQEKWLKSFFGLVFLDSSDVEDCFGDDVMRVLPEDPRCTSFADYLLENYIVPDSRVFSGKSCLLIFSPPGLS
jgi:hypothetical protein